MKEFRTYEEAKASAIADTRKYRVAHGIEKPTAYSGWTTKMLPQKQNRQGFELRCEAVEPEDYQPLTEVL